jgi:hypothetical protein
MVLCKNMQKYALLYKNMEILREVHPGPVSGVVHHRSNVFVKTQNCPNRVCVSCGHEFFHLKLSHLCTFMIVRNHKPSTYSFPNKCSTKSKGGGWNLSTSLYPMMSMVYVSHIICKQDETVNIVFSKCVTILINTLPYTMSFFF